MTVLAPKISQFLFVPYPDENTDPFYDQFEGMVQAFEKIQFYNKMFANMFVTNGGVRTWNPTTGLFTWTADFLILVPHWGYRVVSSFGPDNATRAAVLQDGQFLFLSMPMSMNANINQNFQIGSQLNVQAHDKFVVAARAGSALYIRNIGELA